MSKAAGFTSQKPEGHFSVSLGPKSTHPYNTLNTQYFGGPFVHGKWPTSKCITIHSGSQRPLSDWVSSVLYPKTVDEDPGSLLQVSDPGPRIGISSEWAGSAQPKKFLDFVFMTRSKVIGILKTDQLYIRCILRPLFIAERDKGISFMSHTL